MIQPPQFDEPPIRGNRAARLATDLQQILSFADREFNRPTRAVRNDADTPADRQLDRPPDAAEVHPELATPTPAARPPRAPPAAQREIDVPAPALDGTWRESPRTQGSHSRPGERLGGWRDRAVRNAPWLISQTLVALIAVEMARVSVTIIGGSRPVAPLPAVAMNTRAPARPVVDVHSIITAQFFGVLEADPSADKPDGAPRLAANLLLAGTVATENPKTGLAIISDAGPAEVYKVGARVGGASLDAVYRDRVILSRNGHLETLVLPKPLPKAGSAAPPGPASGAVPAERPAQRRAVALNTPEEASPSE